MLIELLVAWTFAVLAGITGAIMVVVGLFEDLLAIIRSNIRGISKRRI